MPTPTASKSWHRLPLLGNRTHQNGYPISVHSRRPILECGMRQNSGYAHQHGSSLPTRPLTGSQNCNAQHRSHVQTSHKATVTLEHNGTSVRDNNVCIPCNDVLAYERVDEDGKNVRRVRACRALACHAAQHIRCLCLRFQLHRKRHACRSECRFMLA